MQKSSLTALGHSLFEVARRNGSGRSASTVYGGHEHVLRRTLLTVAKVGPASA